MTANKVLLEGARCRRNHEHPLHTLSPPLVFPWYENGAAARPCDVQRFTVDASREDRIEIRRYAHAVEVGYDRRAIVYTGPDPTPYRDLLTAGLRLPTINKSANLFHSYIVSPSQETSIQRPLHQ
jgi:hypothetical protein